MNCAKDYIPPPEAAYSEFKDMFRLEPAALMLPALRVAIHGDNCADELVARLGGFAMAYGADVLGACALEFYAAVNGYPNAMAMLIERDAKASEREPTPVERLAAMRLKAARGFSHSEAKTLASIGR